MSFPEDPPPPASGDWKSALAEFVGARIELIQLEARDARRTASRRLGLALIGATSGIIAWFLLSAGLIGLTSAMTGWPWWIPALIIGSLHLVPAIACLILLRRPSPAPFPITRNELNKDREWLLHLQNSPRSKS